MLQSLKLLEQTLDFWIQGMQPVKPKQIFLLPPPLPPTPPPAPTKKKKKILKSETLLVPRILDKRYSTFFECNKIMD
jgi:hypothetical protein